jgi:hypothetical protein
MRLIADMVGLHFADDPKEIAVEPRILGTRLRSTRAYRGYGASVGMWQWRWAANDCRRPLLVSAPTPAPHLRSRPSAPSS